MPDCEDLLAKARRAPKNLRFRELCQLAECYGFHFARQRGSHVQYKRPGYRTMTFVEGIGGTVKGYQVRQLLDAIDDITTQGD